MQTEQNLTGYPSIDKPWLKYYKEETINASLPECSIYEYLLENNSGSAFSSGRDRSKIEPLKQRKGFRPRRSSRTERKFDFPLDFREKLWYCLVFEKRRRYQ